MLLAVDVGNTQTHVGVFDDSELVEHWRFATEPEPELNNRSIAWPRGRVLGGSGSINGLVFLRGSPHDYDRWAQAGARG